MINAHIYLIYNNPKMEQSEIQHLRSPFLKTESIPSSFHGVCVFFPTKYQLFSTLSPSSAIVSGTWWELNYLLNEWKHDYMQRHLWFEKALRMISAEQLTSCWGFVFHAIVWLMPFEQIWHLRNVHMKEGTTLACELKRQGQELTILSSSWWT